MPAATEQSTFALAPIQVDEAGAVHVVDPARATRAREDRLGADTAIGTLEPHGHSPAWNVLPQRIANQGAGHVWGAGESGPNIDAFGVKRVDPLGNLLWAFELPLSSGSTARAVEDVQHDAAGGAYACGFVQTPATGGRRRVVRDRSRRRGVTRSRDHVTPRPSTSLGELCGLRRRDYGCAPLPPPSLSSTSTSASASFTAAGAWASTLAAIFPPAPTFMYTVVGAVSSSM